jgi:hypothetical protein
MMLFELSKKQFKTRRQQSAANPLPLLKTTLITRLTESNNAFLH